SGSAITLTANNAQNWNGDFTFAGTNSLNMGTGNVTLGGSGDRAVTVTSGTLTVGKITSTSQGLTKNGNGTLQLAPAAASSIGGTLTVNAGTFGIGSQDFTATGLSGAGTIINGSTTARRLIINTTGTGTFSGTLANGSTGTLGFGKQGAGSVILSGSNTFSGVTTLDAGTLQYQANSANTVSGTSAAMSPNSQVTVNGGTIALRADADTTFTASKFNPNGATTTTFDVGALSTGSGNTLSMNSTSAFLIGGAPNATMTFNVTGTNGDQFRLSGGNMSFADIGNTLVLNPTTASMTIANNLVTGINTSHVLNLGGTSSGNFFNGNMTDPAMSLTKSGNSTWTLTGNNTYSGGTTISSGTLAIGNASALGTGNVIDNATLDLNGNSFTANNLSGSGSVTSGTAGSVTLTANNSGDTTFSGVVQDGSGTVGLTKQGNSTLTLSGNNTYSGATNVNAGTLSVNGTSSGAGTVTVASGALLNGSGSIAGAVVVSGSLSGSLTLNGDTTINGGATAAASAFNGNVIANGTITSAVSIQSGKTLSGTGSVGDVTVTSGGTLSPGANGVGTLNVSSLAMGPGTFALTLSGTGAGQYGQVVSSGAVTLGNAVANLNITANYAVNYVLGDLSQSDHIYFSLGGYTSGSFANATSVFDPNYNQTLNEVTDNTGGVWAVFYGADHTNAATLSGSIDIAMIAVPE